MSRLLSRIIVAVCAGMLLFCNQQTISGNGGASETINAMLIVNGTTVSVETQEQCDYGFELQVFAKDYRPFEHTGFSASSRVPDGTPSLTLDSEGFYNAYIAVTSRTSSCFLTDIAVRTDRLDTIPCTLTKTVRIEGTLVSGTEPARGDYAVSVYGSPFFDTTGKEPKFIIDNIPAGEYRVSIRPVARRLFISTADYQITADSLRPTTEVRVELPRP